MAIHGSYGRLDAERLQPLENILRDGAIDTRASKGDAATGSRGVGVASTNVALRWTTFAAVSDFDLAPAASAAEKPWQQGLA
jgi:hypothetical protein